MFKPRVRIVCPVCGIDLSCTARIFSTNDASWVLTAKSSAHLKAANCAVPEPLVLLGENLTTCKEAA